MHECHDRQVILDFIEGNLAPDESQNVGDHIDNCEYCKLVAQEIIHADQVIEPGFISGVLSVQTTPSPLPKIDGFQVTNEIGAGGMGVVYAALDLQSNRKVAIKLVNRMYDSKLAKRFKREQKLLASVVHENIARLYQAGSNKGNPFFVMELVNGKDISTYCSENELNLPQRLKLFLGVCDAVQHLHSKPIVHRDLKPKNILVTEIDDQPVVKVIDFGLAKLLAPQAEDSSNTLPNTTMGTLAYMSPEQASGNNALLGTLTDIYSLGIVLHEILIGQTPISQEKLQSLPIDDARKKIQTEQAKPPSKLIANLLDTDIKKTLGYRHGLAPKDLAGDIDSIILKAIRKEPSLRYETVGQFADDIRKHLDNEPVRARPPSRLYNTKKFLQKHFVLVSFTTALILSLLGGIIGTSYWLVKARAAEKSASTLAKSESEAKDLANEMRKQEQTARIAAEQATAQAELRRKKMQKSSLLLRGFFNGLNPEIAAGGDGQFRGIFVERLKASATELLDEDLSEDEDVLLLRESLANTLVALGEPKAAVPLWELITSDMISLQGDETLDSLSAILNLGVMYTRVSEFEKANQQFERARKIGDAILQPDDPTSVVIDHYTCVNLESMGKLEPSYKIRKQLLQRLGPPSAQTQHLRNDLWNSLGVLELKLNKNTQAITSFETALAGLKKVLPEHHPIALKMRGNLALAASRLKDFKRAELEYRAILRSQKSQFPEDSGPVASTKINLATHLVNAGSIDEGVQLLKEVATTTSDLEYKLNALVELAIVQIRILDEHEKGIASLRNLLSTIKTEFGQQHRLYLLCKQSLDKWSASPAKPSK